MQEKNKIPRDLIGKFLVFFKILLFLHCMTPNYAGLFLYYSYTFHSAYRIFIRIFTLDRILLQTFSKFLFSLFQMLLT